MWALVTSVTLVTLMTLVACDAVTRGGVNTGNLVTWIKVKVGEEK